MIKNKSAISGKKPYKKETEEASDSMERYIEKDDEEQHPDGENNGKNPVYASQYKFLAKRSQLRVWVEKDKYEKFKRAVEKNGTSIYKLINEFVDNYIGEENVRDL